MLARLRGKIIELDLDPVARHKALFLVEALAISLKPDELEQVYDLLEVLL